jgi:glycosyltransferase involved in cell wall biosynthesis
MIASGQCIAHINLASGYRGGERQTELLMRYLADAGWRQILVARAGDDLAGRSADIPGLDINEVSGGIVSAARAFDDATLIHVHQGKALKAAWLQSFFGRRPYIITRRVQKGPRNNLLNRSAYRRAARVIAVSAAIKKRLFELDAGLDIQVIPDCSSALRSSQQRSDAIRKQLGIAAGQFVVGHVGALVDSHKGQLQIIEMARKSRSSGLTFLLIGGGADEAMLKQAAQGLDNVLFTGHVDNVGDYLNLMNLFLYPSRHEGLGSVLLDALEFGVPVVATRVGGIPEIIRDGVNGYLYEPNDTRSMLNTILRLRDDVKTRAAIGVVNKRAAEAYTPARMGKRYELIYQSVLGSRA